MTHNDPLGNSHETADATFMAWGDGPGAARVVECFGPVEIEYAALRRGCALFDWPQRGLVRVNGGDRRDFLNRLLSQELKDLREWRVRRSFWLNRLGRIDADLRVLETDEAMLLDLDRLVAARTVEALEKFVITEDVAIADESERRRRLALHGPTAGALLGAVCVPVGEQSPAGLGEGEACEAVIGGARVIVDRQDSCGEAGYELLVPADAALAVYEEIARVGADAAFRLRRAGWHAYNVARLEAGWPLYLVDFGPDSIPNETGVMHDRVSFKKGCYLGQEVVTRIHSRGQPRRKLVAVRFDRREETLGEQRIVAQPETGATVTTEDSGEAPAIGAVTSSVVSPMLGDTPIGFATVKTAQTGAGTVLYADAARGRLRGEVQEGLRFWSREDAAASAR